MVPPPFPTCSRCLPPSARAADACCIEAQKKLILLEDELFNKYDYSLIDNTVPSSNSCYSVQSCATSFEGISLFTVATQALGNVFVSIVICCFRITASASEILGTRRQRSYSQEGEKYFFHAEKCLG